MQKFMPMTNKLILPVESRMQGDLHVRFGGRPWETYHRKVARRPLPSLQAKAEAMDAALTGTDYEKKQSAKEYTNGEMYYYIWLNPDVDYSDTTNTISESPTVRNQVYHAHITGFGEMGVADKDEINPDEDLETKKTHLSVQLRVLPWTIHSYTVNLVNRY